MPPGAEYDEQRILDLVSEAVTVALAPSLFKVYPRHRWVGCDTALDQLALAECVHGLGSAAFLLMCGQEAPGEEGHPAPPAAPPEGSAAHDGGAPQNSPVFVANDVEGEGGGASGLEAAGQDPRALAQENA